MVPLLILADVQVAGVYDLQLAEAAVRQLSGEGDRVWGLSKVLATYLRGNGAADAVAASAAGSASSAPATSLPSSPSSSSGALEGGPGGGNGGGSNGNGGGVGRLGPQQLQSLLSRLPADVAAAEVVSKKYHRTNQTQVRAAAAPASRWGGAVHWFVGTCVHAYVGADRGGGWGGGWACAVNGAAHSQTRG